MWVMFALPAGVATINFGRFGLASIVGFVPMFFSEV
jgi:hypothetical protein